MEQLEEIVRLTNELQIQCRELREMAYKLPFNDNSNEQTN